MDHILMIIGMLPLLLAIIFYLA